MYQNLSLGYRVEFSRVTNNTTFKNDDTIFKNIIIMDVKNNIGLTIYSIRMNEGDCIRLLDYITAYLYDFFGWGDKCEIQLPISTVYLGKYPIIHFQNISDRINKEDINYQDNHFNEYRYHEMSILEVDTNNQNHTMKILSIPMGCTEVEEFVYNLYFTGLMDLDLPDEILEHLDEVLGRIFGANWYNYD